MKTRSLSLDANGPLFESEEHGGFLFLTVEEVVSRRPASWLVEGLLRPGDLGMIYGPPGVGKTFVALDLILSAITGAPFAGRFPVSCPLSVCYVAGEGVSGLQGRLQALLSTRGLSPEEAWRLRVVEQAVRLYEEGDLHDVRRFVRGVYDQSEPEMSVDLLVIDTLHAASAGADENSARDAGIVVAALSHLARELDCAVLVIHHANRAGSNARGSNAFDATWSLMIELQDRHPRDPLMRCAKSKDAAPFPSLAYTLSPHGDSQVVVWQGEATAEAAGGVREALAAILSQGAWMTAQELAAALGTSAGTVNNELSTLVRSDTVERRKRGRAYEYGLARAP